MKIKQFFIEMQNVLFCAVLTLLLGGAGLWQVHQYFFPRMPECIAGVYGGKISEPPAPGEYFYIKINQQKLMVNETQDKKTGDEIVVGSHVYAYKGLFGDRYELSLCALSPEDFNGSGYLLSGMLCFAAAVFFAFLTKANADECSFFGHS